MLAASVRIAGGLGRYRCRRISPDVRAQAVAALLESVRGRHKTQKTATGTVFHCGIL